MNERKKILEINDSFKTRECYNGINTIICTFQEISKIDDYDLFEIKCSSKFLPSKILILVGFFIQKYIDNGKTVYLNITDEKVNKYVTECGLDEFLSTKKITKNKLLSSVALPFSRISEEEDIKKYISDYSYRLPTEHKSDLADWIYELHGNSVEHGKTEDIFISGQVYPRNGEVDITVYDSGTGLLDGLDEDRIKSEYPKYMTQEFFEDTIKVYGLKVFFIILCVCTRYSNKGIGRSRGRGLKHISDFLLKNNGIIQIATDEIYVSLQIKNDYDKIDLGDITINYMKLKDFICGTYISFTFLI